MPKRILESYFQYMDNLDGRFQICKTLGTPHRDTCSIPHGCPLSINMVALFLMRPWIMKMKENGIEPRTHANDLFFFASGKDNEIKAMKGMEISLQFFQDIGAKVAKTSSCEKTRNSLRGKLFGEKGVPMKVMNQCTDLGGHVCMDFSKSAVTLNQRMERAIEKIHRLKWTKITQKEETGDNQKRYPPSCPVWE